MAHYDIITQRMTLSDDVAEGVQDHRIAVSDLVVIHADRISEDSIYSVFIGSRRPELYRKLVEVAAGQTQALPSSAVTAKRPAIEDDGGVDEE